MSIKEGTGNHLTEPYVLIIKIAPSHLKFYREEKVLQNNKRMSINEFRPGNIRHYIQTNKAICLSRNILLISRKD